MEISRYALTGSLTVAYPHPSLSLHTHAYKSNTGVGSISQWGQVKKKHGDKAKTKAKDHQAPSTESAPGGRGGRGRGFVESRGRGRGDRGRGGRGGRAGSQSNGVRVNNTKPTTDGWGESPVATDTSSTWDTAAPPGTSPLDAPTNGETTTASDWASADAPKEAPAEEQKKESAPAPKSGTWANLFATKPPVVPKVPVQPAATEQDHVEATTPKPVEDSTEEILPEAVIDNSPNTIATHPTSEVPSADDSVTITPSKDELTETNLEQLPDTSFPPATATAASTVASTQDPHSALNSAVPHTRPGLSGYAASALKATSGSNRSSSFQRRFIDQQEPVVMPGDRAVDRTAVQFGSMGLNGEQLDVDEDREEAETRAQPPKESPSAPRASLPPAPAVMQTHSQQQPELQSEALAAPRPAPGLPPAPQQPSPAPATSYTDFGRYGQIGPKSYDSFGQQTAQQPTSGHETYPSPNTTAPQQHATTSAPSDYSNFYGTSQPQRDPYQNYYGSYGQSQDSQQRSGSAFATASQDMPSLYGTSGVQSSTQGSARFGQQEPQDSGSSTPNPVLQGQQSQSAQHLSQGQGSHAGYPYGYPNANYQYHPQYYQMGNQHQYGRNRPMFDDARRYDDSFMGHNSHYGYGSQYGGFGNKQGMYGQPHQYPYGNSSPADPAFSQSSMGGRDSAYGRTNSTQPQDTQQSANNSAFGSLSESYGRSQSGFGNHSGPQQQIGQHSGSEESAKAYDPAKTGPSPSITQAHRPGSAANTMQAQQGGQSGFPPPQSQHSGQQQAFSGYPQYGGLGGLGGHQGHQNQTHQSTGYGYGSNQGFGNYGYGNTGGRGWGGNYGGH